MDDGSLKLTFPPNAVESGYTEVEMAVSTLDFVSPPGYSVIGVKRSLKPEGMKFDLAVAVEFPLGSTAIKYLQNKQITGEHDILIYSTADGKEYYALDNARFDTGSRKVTGDLYELSNLVMLVNDGDILSVSNEDLGFLPSVFTTEGIGYVAICIVGVILFLCLIASCAFCRLSGDASWKAGYKISFGDNRTLYHRVDSIESDSE